MGRAPWPLGYCNSEWTETNRIQLDKTFVQVSRMIKRIKLPLNQNGVVPVTTNYCFFSF